jgi:dCMP deaminase
MDWHTWFFDMLEVVRSKSKDPSTKVGALVVGPYREVRSMGYNGFPRGVNDSGTRHPERHTRPNKYLWTEHAERNAIYNACRVGVSLAGCTMYVTAFPCSDCSRGIIQSGISTVIYKPWVDVDTTDRWITSMKVSWYMFQDAGIAVYKYTGVYDSELGNLDKTVRIRELEDISK